MHRRSGLNLEFRHFRVPDDADDCRFDPVAAVGRLFSGRAAKWSGVVGAALCPVGDAFGEHMTLVMAPDGAVYAGVDSFLVIVGRSPHDAVNAMC